VFKLIPLHPSTSAEGFVTSTVDVLRLFAECMGLAASVDRRRFDTGLNENDWATFVTDQALAKIKKLSAELGITKPKPSGAEHPEAAILTVAQKLDNAVNQTQTSVRLCQDGPSAQEHDPLSGKANPNGGFTWLDGKDGAGGVFARSLDFVIAQKFFEASKTKFPAMPMDKDAPTVSDLGLKYARLLVAMSTPKLTAKDKVWGPSFWGDNRDKIPFLVDTQRAINVLSLAFAASLQPYLLLYRNAARFLLDPRVWKEVEKRKDAYRLDTTREAIMRVAAIALLPMASVVDALSSWTDIETPWGKMAHYPLCTQLNGLGDPGHELLGRGSPFLKMTTALDEIFNSPPLKRAYETAAAVFGSSAGGGSIRIPGPLNPALEYTDGLFATATPSSPFQAFFTLWRKGNDHIGQPNKAIQLTPNENRPTIQVRPDLSDFIGELEEKNTPRSWRPNNDKYYQGDADAKTEPLDVKTVSSLFNISEDELRADLKGEKSSWSHLFRLEGDKVEALHHTMYYSPRTKQWWMKHYLFPYLGATKWFRWLEGQRLDKTDAVLSADAKETVVEWWGYLTPEMPQLNTTVEGMVSGLLTAIGAQ